MEVNNKIIIIIFLMFVLQTGAILNTFVIATNNGKMPVLTEDEVNNSMYFSYSDKKSINNWFISDIITIGGTISSVGDVLMVVSLAVILFLQVLLFIERRRERRKKRDGRRI